MVGVTGPGWRATALGRPWVLVALCVALAVALRLPFVDRVAYPDEGGLLLVAEHWHTDGPGLYGRLFVDRPPLLLLFFLAGHALGGLMAVRLMGVAMVAVFVAAAGRAGWLLADRMGAGWAALAAAAFVANPVLGTHEVNAELIGIPLTMAGAVVALEAVRRQGGGPRQRALLVAAGMLLGAAPLVKQNLVDGVAFGLVLLAGQAWTRTWRVRRAAAALGWLSAGVVLPTLATGLWALGLGPGGSALWRAVVDFRFHASAVMAATPSPAVRERLGQLPVLMLLSGLGVVLLIALWRLRGRLLREPAVAASAVMLFVAAAGVLLGGNYWSHYLIALLPATVLLVGCAAALPRPSIPSLRLVIAGALGSVLVANVVATRPAVTELADPQISVTAWLSAASLPDDTGVVTYGSAQILEASGLRPGYPYLWSLPVRTLDPELTLFTRRLEQENRPVWLIEWMPLDTWSLDQSGRARAAVEAHYRRVATVCGVPIYLRNGEERILPATPTDCGER